MEDASANAPQREQSSEPRSPPARWHDLRSWIDLVESNGGLKRIDAVVDLDEELAAVTYLAAKRARSPGLLFERPAGDTIGARVLSNMLGASVERYALTLGFDPALPTLELVRATRSRMACRVAPVRVDARDAPVSEVVATGRDIDLRRLPAPRFWPGDGGAYLGTGDITLTRDPGSGRLNVGTYRQMLHDRDRVGMYCSPGKHGKLDREAWWARGEPCPIVAAYGIDPAMLMVGGLTFSHTESELDVAGGLAGRPVRLAPGTAGPLPIPADAEIVIEGELHPGDTELEGPLGEFTGYYGNERAPQPVIRVKALHHRRRPIVTAALMAPHPAGEIGAYAAIMRSARIWSDLEQLGVPGIAGVYTPPAAAAGWGITVVSIAQRYAGHVAQVLALAAQVPAGAYYTKWIIAVDDDVDPTDMDQVLWAMSTRCDPETNLDLLRNTWSTGLDPSKGPPAERPYGSKVLIDACKPHRHLATFPMRTLLRGAAYERVRARWSELGFDGEAPRERAFHPEQGS